MEINEKAILGKTHYGLKIYSLILRKYYENETVLHLSGYSCEPTKNPFTNHSQTLQLKMVEGQFLYSDSNDASFHGNPFNFAALHYKAQGHELLEILNNEMHLHLGEKPKNASSINFDLVEKKPKPKPVLPRFSYFKAPITNTVPEKEVTILDVYHLIRYGFQSQTDELRAITDKTTARKYKAAHFDYVTFSGLFTKRNDQALQKHSGLLALDFDHVADLQSLKNLLLQDEYFETEILFTSPSGDGLKWIVAIDLMEYGHREWFTSIANYIRTTYQLAIDQAGKDVSRACFLPHDSNIYLHPKYHS